MKHQKKYQDWEYKAAQQRSKNLDETTKNDIKAENKKSTIKEGKYKNRERKRIWGSSRNEYGWS